MSGNRAINHQENIVPKINTFFAVLAASQQREGGENPMQAFHASLRELKQVAEAGDIRAWQRQLQAFEGVIEELGLEGHKELEARIHIVKLEMTLLLAAGNNATASAKLAEQEAAEATKQGAVDKAGELTQKAQKQYRLGRQFHDQLLSKTA